MTLLLTRLLNSGVVKMAEHTILFVDDEESILKTIKRLFMDEDYRIITANGGQAALDLLNGGETPAVIVSDQRMPQMGGAEFLAKAKEKLPQSIRMVLTGYADVNAAVEAINLGGIYRYILKPWNDDDLKLSVKEAVERFDLVVQNKRLTEELKEKNNQLSDWNKSLEVKVEERTRELQDALSKNQQLNASLKVKIKELEGRDRIQQHLLTIHPLPDTLQLILEVVGEIVKFDAAAIFLADEKKGGDIKLGATLSDMREIKSLFEDTGQGSTFSGYKKALLQSISSGEIALLAREDVWINETVQDKVQIALLPISKGGHALGAVVVARVSNKPISEAYLRVVNSFSMQAAVAISDSLLQQDLPSLESALDDVLNDLPG
jgi:FixJ family two-component response regulator